MFESFSFITTLTIWSSNSATKLQLCPKSSLLKISPSDVDVNIFLVSFVSIATDVTPTSPLVSVYITFQLLPKSNVLYILFPCVKYITPRSIGSGVTKVIYPDLKI